MEKRIEEINRLIKFFPGERGRELWIGTLLQDFIEIYNDLPGPAKAYVRRIEELCGIPASLVSVGPEREKTLWLDRFFE